MPKLKYIGPKSFGHIVYGPTTRTPYRVHPGRETQIDVADRDALLATGEWEKITPRSARPSTSDAAQSAPREEV